MRQRAGQHFALMRKAFTFTDGKSRFLQATPDKTRSGKGRQRSSGTCQPCQSAEQRRGPHIRIFRRRKAVQEPGVNLTLQALIKL